MSREISEITRDITLQNEQLDADRRGLAHIIEQIAAVGDAEKTIQDWRVQMARLGRPSVLVPKHMLDDQRALQAHNATKAALEASISARQDKIAALEQELAEAQEQATDATWQFISDEADRLAKVLVEQQAAYTDTARKLFALNQLSRPGKREYFTDATQRIFAPLPGDAPRTAYLQAQHLDPLQYAAQIKPYVTAAQEWRAALIKNPDTPYSA